MLLLTSSKLTDIVFNRVLDSALGVVRLHEVELSLLSDQRAVVLPLRGVIFRTVEADELVVSGSVFRNRNAEGVVIIRPEPNGFCIPVVEDRSVVVLRMINHLELRVEIHTLFVFRVLRVKA